MSEAGQGYIAIQPLHLRHGTGLSTLSAAGGRWAGRWARRGSRRGRGRWGARAQRGRARTGEQCMRQAGVQGAGRASIGAGGAQAGVGRRRGRVGR